jgi:hypothetical protein
MNASESAINVTINNPTEIMIKADTGSRKWEVGVLSIAFDEYFFEISSLYYYFVLARKNPEISFALKMFNKTLFFK